jgi:hypothetical protein
MNRYDIAQYVDSIAQDIMAEREHWETDDLHDIAYERAADSEYVIYYSQAHEFVQALDGVELNEAERQIFDCGINPESYNDFTAQIAFWALYELIMEAVTEKLEQEEAAEEA